MCYKGDKVFKMRLVPSVVVKVMELCIAVKSFNANVMKYKDSLNIKLKSVHVTTMYIFLT